MFKNTDELKATIRAEGYGNFFSTLFLSGCNPRVLKEIYQGKYFITSEQLRDKPRRYTIRQFSRTASTLKFASGWKIDTVGKVQQYESKEAAMRAVQLLK